MQQLLRTKQLLNFLKDLATLRRKRVTVYGSKDKVLWLADLPSDLPSGWKDAWRSVFSSEKPDETPELWLEVRKKRKPEFPVIPKEIEPWLPDDFLDNLEEYALKDTEDLLGLLQGKTDSDTSKNPEISTEYRNWTPAEELERLWLEYLVNQWDPWAKEFRIWQKVQQLYEDVDFMRRRLEEAEERYELVLAIGLLQWRNPTGITIKRHLLTAPAEIFQDAIRGILTVTPAASFNGFRIELDMLEFQHRPDLDPVKTELENLLEELNVRAWDKIKAGDILRLVANRAASDAQIDENLWRPLKKADETFRIVLAPALVLRERRPTAYDELITRFLKAVEEDPNFSTTIPWGQFVDEDKTQSDPLKILPKDGRLFGNIDDRLYFPRPMNDEQKRIAEQLRKKPYVLVKGPPGTGKSYTIANLICHLLALGERVLVTAQAPKALAVLRNLLPGDISNLCVMAFSSTREDQRLLEESIRKILSRRNSWNAKSALEKINKLEKELLELEKRQAKLDNRLRQCREAETYSHTLFGGYQGTAAQIAKQLEHDQKVYGWFPEVVGPDARCPLEKSELRFLAEVHASLTEERLKELKMEAGNFLLPDPEEFDKLMGALFAAEKQWQALAGTVEPEKLNRLLDVPEADLEICKTFLHDLEKEIINTDRALGRVSKQILRDFLLGQGTQWLKIIQNLEPLLGQIQETYQQVGTAQVEISEDIEHTKLLRNARRRFEHFKKGGRKGFSIFAPKVVRETRYIEEKCWVNGQSPRDTDALQILVAYLDLEKYIQQMRNALPELADLMKQSDPRVAAQTVEKFVHQIFHLSSLLEKRGQQALGSISLHERALLVEPGEIQKWLALLKAEMARRSLEKLKEELKAWSTKIQALPESNAHPCMLKLAQAIVGKDAARWKVAWEERECFKEKKKDFHRYQKLSQRLDQECPGLKNLLDANRGHPEWRDRILHLDRAWTWAAARAWLRQVTDASSYCSILEQRKNVEEKIKTTLLRLVELKAWKAFFDRLDKETKQNLVAWQKAMARVGKGTGKHAFKHRRSARKYLKDCIQKIPIWVMPIHKLWDTVIAKPGMFDTIIVDEASQAGLDSLILLLLGKRVVVVGDDKQNSPEAVGISEEDITRLAKEHLRDFHFREEFRPDASLYDHAERVFGNVTSLREHFRCVPEIIRFSNDLCYTDSPLIPLRQPPPDRLPPLKTVYVSGGFCEGEGQRLINRPEADEIVRTVQECIKNEAYKGKTMGIIVLQGHAQAELIERKLAEVLEPKERAERKLRCGVPATFQGDERDVIFLSLVVAPNHSYRALTSLADQRRFNVAMSRAKDQVWLFHSVRQHELSREDLRWWLLNFFDNSNQKTLEDFNEERERLEREVLRRPRQLGTQPESYESWFEVDVALELLRRGYRVKPQFKVSGYRIDLVVEGIENRLAVECDGDTWHGPEQFERDIFRQRQLERVGWNFVRIRESEFYADRKRALQLIEERCEELNIYPVV